MAHDADALLRLGPDKLEERRHPPAHPIAICIAGWRPVFGEIIKATPAFKKGKFLQKLRLWPSFIAFVIPALRVQRRKNDATFGRFAKG